MNVVEFKKKIVDGLTRRDYGRKTAVIYSKWIDDLFQFLGDIPPENVSFDDLKDFLDHVIERKKYAPGTIKSIFNAIVFGFNEVLERNFDLASIPRPYQQRKISVILTQTEVYRLLQAVTNIKYRVLIAMVYSCGLDIGEAVRLRPSDVHLKRAKLRIRNIRKRSVREAPLARYVLDELANYIEEYKPIEWLFPSKVANKAIGIRSTQTAFTRALHATGIEKSVTLKNLKYSYVKHLEEQGIPLISVLKFLGLSQEYSLIFYSKLNEPAQITIHSPLDRIIRADDELEVDLSSLEKMLKRVTREDERDYLLESLQCMKARALRAGVIFAWSAAVQNIRRRCSTHSLNSVNLNLKRHNPKAHEIKGIDDFAKIDESLLLLLAADLGIFDKNQKDILVGCLDLRNKCGHPGKYKPKLFKAASLLEDLVTIVFT
jgi:integrase